MRLRVLVSAEDCLELAGIGVGARFSEWLLLEELGRWPMPKAAVQVVRGTASAVSSWPGAEHARYPTRVDIGTAALYWDAPEPEDGDVVVEGLVRLNRIDAPPDFPASVGQVQQIWVAQSAADAACAPDESARLVARDRIPRLSPRPTETPWAILEVEFAD